MKKKLILLLLLISLSVSSVFGTACDKPPAGPQEISIFSRPVTERNGLNEDGKKCDWLDVASFSCYYGAYTEEMTNFDVAICESMNLGVEGIKKLNDAGVWTICYITIGEDDSLNTADGLGEGGYASYYLYENGSPKVNSNWNSYFVDAGNPVWQQIIVERARDILEMGADGLFLDTIDSVDVDTATSGGMVSLIKRLSEEFPEAKLVANRGFTVLEYCAEYIDGMMFESFNTTWNFEKNMADDLSESDNEYNIATAVNTINRMRQQYYFPVFALDYVNELEISYMAQTYIDRSWTYDFIPYLTTVILLNEVTVYSQKPQSERGSLALKGEGDIAENAGKPNGDVSEFNLAYVKNGATLTVDSYFSVDYKNNKAEALNDGFISETLYWAKRAWASADEKVASGEPYKNDHYIEIEFTEAKQVSLVNVYWAFDNGVYYTSQQVIVEVWGSDGWQQVGIAEGIASGAQETNISFAPVNAKKLRIRQPAGFGPSFRAGIMWVAEVEVYSEAE